jgi:acylglycerol lipase
MPDSETFINTRDQSIFFKQCTPSNIQAVVIFFHGIAEHSQRFTHLYNTMVARNIAVFAMDQHGHGKSEGERVFCNHFSDFIDDANQFTALVRERMEKRNQKLKYFIMGMSFGGLVACHTVLSAKHKFDGIILAAPAIGVELDTALRVYKACASFLTVLIPHARIVPAVRIEGRNL